MTSAPAVSRPTSSPYLEGQRKLFLASGAAQLAWLFWPPAYAPWWAWGGALLFAAATIRPAVEGLALMRVDYLNRRSWAIAQQPASAKNVDHGVSTYAERHAAGMYDGQGRTLGRDEHGYPVFVPHRHKPNFHLIVGGQGSGKTSTGAIISSVLTALWRSPGQKGGA